jgi:predicted hydrocarbon binding protein
MAFVDLFRKLLVGREIKFEDGKLIIFNEDWIMLPVKILAEVFSKVLEDPKMSSKLYYVSKDANKKGMSKVLVNKYGFKDEKFLNLATDMAQMGGWGEIKIMNLDVKKGTASVNIYNSPVARLLRGSKKPVDHVWRGTMAGGMSKAVGKDIDLVEVECIAMGKKFCSFVAKPRKEWLKDKSPMVKEQLGL